MDFTFRDHVKTIYQKYLQGDIPRDIAYRRFEKLLKDYGLMALDHRLPDDITNENFLGLLRWAFNMNPQPTNVPDPRHFSAPMNMLNNEESAAVKELREEINTEIRKLLDGNLGKPLPKAPPSNQAPLNRIRFLPPAYPAPPMMSHYIPPKPRRMPEMPTCPICHKETSILCSTAQFENRIIQVNPARCQECTFDYAVKEFEKKPYIMDTKHTPLTTEEEKFFAGLEDQMKVSPFKELCEHCHRLVEPDHRCPRRPEFDTHTCPKCGFYYDTPNHVLGCGADFGNEKKV
jgi:hypothetical protein